MNRLSVRLVLSHVLVAVLGALATFFIVRQLAPALFDETLRRAQGGGPRGPGQGMGQNAGLREQFATAVDQALPVSYTHLDVYKRQLQHRQATLRPLAEVLDGMAPAAQPKWAAWRRRQRLHETPEQLQQLLDQCTAFADPCLLYTSRCV